jgi:UDP-N-acetylglucosamine acyltransferase
MSEIHPTASVNPGAKISAGVKIGPFSVIEDDVEIGEGTVIHNNVTINAGARLGKDNIVYPYAVLAAIPQDLKFKGQYSQLVIGNNNVIREFVTISRSTIEGNKTVVGNNCLFMANSHTGHDCIIGNNCIVVNSVALAGHVVLEDYVVLGGLVGVHQFVRIGRNVMVGAHSMVVKDVPPYCLFSGNPLQYEGLNLVGLKRRNFKPVTIEELKKAYKLIYNSGLNVSQALAKIKSDLPQTEEIKHLVNFIEAGGRGISK